jgi:aryl-alcohol dehydrogenase-like predicted oxidoreductase
MESRSIGSLQVSVVGLGCNNFGRRLDADRTAAVVDAALDAGIDFFDTADLYGDGASEEFLGRALGTRRQRVSIATKFGHESSVFGKGARPDHIRSALEGSLARLGTDYVDLYLVHQPDPETPIADTLGVLDELVRAGKVREIGCSNFSAEQLREAEAAVRPGAARFLSVQNQYSLLDREPEEGVLQESERQGLGFLPWYPLASGLLTGKYHKGERPQSGRLSEGERYARFLTDEKLDLVERLAAFAEGRGHTILELAVSWLLVRPTVASVIAGATKPEQVRANADAAGWRLSEEELAEVDRIVGANASK